MTYTVIGGGFGLYGYLPALISRGKNVVLPVKYRERITRRVDLRRFESQIDWVPTMEDALHQAKTVVIATPPAAQVVMVKRVLNDFSNIEDFFLEKPLAESPESAEQLLNELERHSKACEVGFILLKSPWLRKLAVASKESTSISIIWHFQAHHFQHGIQSWKRNHAEGGGPLRFYGIHIIALISSLGYSRVKGSFLTSAHRNALTKWSAAFVGLGLAQCDVEVDSASTSNLFRVKVDSEILVQMADPFGDAPSVDLTVDRRVGLLGELIENKTRNDLSALRKIISLWAEIERVIVP